MTPDAVFSTPGLAHLPLGQNFGTRTHAIEHGGISINAADHEPGMVVPAHVHDNPYICVVERGAFEFSARRTYECTPGSLIGHPAGLKHGNRFADRAGRCVNIHFGNAWTDDALIRGWLDRDRHVNLGKSAHALRRLTRELAMCDAAAPLAAVSAAIELVSDAMRVDAPRAQPVWLARVIDMLEADLASAPGLRRVAFEVGTHPAHLSRVFRATYGETMGEYVRRRRVERADRALRDGMQSLAEIAAAAGFSDQAHFGRVYRRHFGISPGALRRRLQLTF